MVMEYKAVIEKPEDLIGRGVSINGRYYKLPALIDTDYDDGRYLPLNEHMENELRREILEIEFYALTSTAFTTWCSLGKAILMKRF